MAAAQSIYREKAAMNERDFDAAVAECCRVDPGSTSASIAQALSAEGSPVTPKMVSKSFKRVRAAMYEFDMRVAAHVENCPGNDAAAVAAALGGSATAEKVSASFKRCWLDIESFDRLPLSKDADPKIRTALRLTLLLAERRGKRTITVWGAGWDNAYLAEAAADRGMSVVRGGAPSASPSVSRETPA